MEKMRWWRLKSWTGPFINTYVLTFSMYFTLPFFLPKARSCARRSGILGKPALPEAEKSLNFKWKRLKGKSLLSILRRVSQVFETKIVNVFFQLFSLPLASINCNPNGYLNVYLKVRNGSMSHAWQASLVSNKYNTSNCTIFLRHPAKRNL